MLPPGERMLPLAYFWIPSSRTAVSDCGNHWDMVFLGWFIINPIMNISPFKENVNAFYPVKEILFESGEMEVFMELNMKAIGNRIKERRKELNLTQLDIKEKVGISSGNISDIERGNRLPAATTLVQLSDVLDCSIDYILTGKSPSGENFVFSSSGESFHKLLTLFFALSKEDQEEILLIAEMKANKGKRMRPGKSSPSEDIEIA